MTQFLLEISFTNPSTQFLFNAYSHMLFIRITKLLTFHIRTVHLVISVNFIENT